MILVITSMSIDHIVASAKYFLATDLIVCKNLLFKYQPVSVFTTQPTPPINLRAKQVKSELEETKALRARLESREADIRELKMTLRTKQEEFGELQVRKDLAEKRLANTSREDKMANEKLEVCFKFLISTV